MFIASGWKDFEVLDTGNGEKLERWGDYLLARPDPQVIWPCANERMWQKAHAHYTRSERGGGAWDFHTKLPEKWVISYQDLKFYVRPTGFKHTGLFPEQAANWDYIGRVLKSFKNPQPQVLNLFAYTGAASLMAKASGAETTHVDSIKQVITWANRNQEISGLKDIRWLVEDAFKFVKKELKRGKRYHGIIMDPPAYGHGPKGEKWKLENQIEDLVGNSLKLLEPSEHFFILNTYTPGFVAEHIRALIEKQMPAVQQLETGQLVLEATSGKKLPVSSFGRFHKLT